MPECRQRPMSGQCQLCPQRLKLCHTGNSCVLGCAPRQCPVLRSTNLGFRAGSTLSSFSDGGAGVTTGGLRRSGLRQLMYAHGTVTTDMWRKSSCTVVIAARQIARCMGVSHPARHGAAQLLRGCRTFAFDNTGRLSSKASHHVPQAGASGADRLSAPPTSTRAQASSGIALVPLISSRHTIDCTLLTPGVRIKVSRRNSDRAFKSRATTFNT